MAEETRQRTGDGWEKRGGYQGGPKPTNSKPPRPAAFTTKPPKETPKPPTTNQSGS